MKRILFISLISLSIMSMAMPLSLAAKSSGNLPKPSVIKPPKPSLSMLELTSSEMFRYGREKYLRGDYAESAKVFLTILSHDCSNKIAQYHLRKIAAEAPSLAFLNEKLDKLPCKAHDFAKEDFLPSSLYYENDNKLMLEQVISYKKRYQLSEKELMEKIDQYMAMVQELEATVKLLKDKDAQYGATLSLGTVSQETLTLIEDGRKSADKIAKEISYLKNQLASQRLDQQKEVQDLRTRVSEAETHLTDEAPRKSGTSLSVELPSPAHQGTEKTYSDPAKTLLSAITQAKAELADKEKTLAEKDKVILTLQSRFDDIQRRLQAIQNDLANKNAQIQAIQNNLQDTQKP